MVMHHARNIITVPASIEEADAALERIGRIDQEIEQRIATLTEEALLPAMQQHIISLKEERHRLETGLKEFIRYSLPAIETNAECLRLSAGRIGWRKNDDDVKEFFVEPDPLPDLEIDPIDPVVTAKPA